MNNPNHVVTHLLRPLSESLKAKSTLLLTLLTLSLGYNADVNAQTVAIATGPNSAPCESRGVSNGGSMISICAPSTIFSHRRTTYYTNPSALSQTILNPSSNEYQTFLEIDPYINANGVVSADKYFVTSPASWTLNIWNSLNPIASATEKLTSYKNRILPYFVDSNGDAIALASGKLIIFPPGTEPKSTEIANYDQACSFAGASFKTVSNGAPVIVATCAFGKKHSAAILTANANASGGFPTSFTLTQLKIPSSFDRCDATGINDKLRIIGTCMSSSLRYAVYWDPTTANTPTYGDAKLFQFLTNVFKSSADAINAQGNVAVSIQGQDGKKINWIWAPDNLADTHYLNADGMTTVGISDNNNIFANGQNSSQQKTGYVFIAGSATATTIPTPTGSNWLTVTAQSANGTYASANVATGAALVTMP